LLDLACGPGRLALDLASAFDEVWAIDLEPEMIEVGRRLAAERGVGNVRWQVGRAEDLAAPAGGFDLITIGEAFHRLDQRVVAAKAFAWLRPGGRLATMGVEGILGGREPWQALAAGVARRWMARAFPRGWGAARDGAVVEIDAVEHLLREAGFVEVATRQFSQPHAWSLDQIVGYLESTSVCSRRALGGDFEAFEAELRAALADRTPSLRFHEQLRAGCTLARKPG
jgi:SAM-dependent methyltransferase